MNPNPTTSEPADIVLAECSGQAWLVRGEQHIDDLLGNTLPNHVSIDVIPCESKSAVDALWRRFGGGNDDEDKAWLIHPAIVNRARSATGPAAIHFAPWSANIDDAARAAAAAAADLAIHREAATLVILRHVDEAAPPMALDMANLRSGLIEAVLVDLGLPTTRTTRETTQPENPGLADQIHLILRDP